MNYTTVFDVNKKTTVWTYYIPIFLFLIFFTVFFIVGIVRDDVDIMYVTSSAIIAICFLIWSLINITQVIADHLYLIIPYKKHQCEQIEGIISNLVHIEHTARAESFEVSGMRFVFPNSSTRIGYKTTASKGGFITENGQNVRIVYVYNEKLGNDNVILKLEVALEEDKLEEV